ncbi:MAG: beta-lactamase family protein, partial [Chryseobacterium sp.]|nr:beta-lactamase family protein [Candidatus Chryseobacterium enterohippi]
YIDSLFVHHKVMGSFAMATQDQPNFVKSVGYVDLETKKQANMNTQYRIGSISKTFTSVLVMKTIEDQKLKLSSTLSEFFPEIENAKSITIENLLQHKSGIHNLTDEKEYWDYNTLPQTESSLLTIIKKYPSDFAPGTKFEYSNSNYILLGFILEKIYKKSYAELIQDKIAKPLKLKLTKVGGRIDTSKNQAKSYIFENKNYVKWHETDMSIPIGAGNLISTPSELLTFIIALENGKLVSKESLTQMKKFEDHYGLGISDVPFGKYWGYGHNGGIDQFLSTLYYFPELKSGISFITNQSDYDNNQISINMMSVATNQDFEMPNFNVFQVDAALLKQYEGTYKADGFPIDIIIVAENGVLKAQATGQGQFPLTASSNSEFKFDTAHIKMKFDAEKKTMDFSQGSHQYVFKKQ